MIFVRIAISAKDLKDRSREEPRSEVNSSQDAVFRRVRRVGADERERLRRLP